jgi:PHD/YefM family antitoxin component YafN of YafNO toxin-antitoxin module
VTQENKQKNKKRPALKYEFVSRDDPQNFDETDYLLRSPKNAICLLESIESLKEGRVVPTSFSELT